ncbi:MAG TPA: HPF/RaiA family ribosome-associated protein [Beijerinckia sp.]|jgi:hypothetical protein|nr:HPF/RaiA family ribosome-associated protein [Beijerinckia sp.]
MDRPLQIAFRNTKPSGFLERFIQERMLRLERFYNHITGCRVVVEIPHQSPEAAKKALAVAVEVEVPGRPKIIGKSEEDRHDTKGDQRPAVNRAFDAVRRQLEEIIDIKKGQVKRHDDLLETGVVARLFPAQNYGFIEVRGAPDLYFTRNAVVRGSFDEMAVGAMVQVTRATSEGPMGPQASSVRLVEPL